MRVTTIRGCISALVVSLMVCRALAQSSAPGPATRPAGPGRWESAIAAFEAQDRRSPPPRDAVLFVGSSSIVGWKLGEFFGDLATINRGFGGSQLSDSLHFIDRIVLPYRPRAIVLYAGENDVWAGELPDQVARDFEAFARRVRDALPHAKLIYIGLKPSPSRWSKIEQFRETNRLVRAFVESQAGMTFVDVERAMLDERGQPRGNLFVKDMLHMNRAGYEIWTGLVRPLVDEESADAASPATMPAAR